MHVDEAAGDVQQDADTVLPLEHRQLGVHEAIVECSSVHQLEHKAAPGAIERNSKEAIDVWVASAAEQVDFVLDLHVQ